MNVEQEMIRYDRVRHLNAYVSEIIHKSEHMHGSFEISYVLDGTAQYVQGAQKREVGPGALILTNPYEQHSYTALTEKPLLLLTFQIHKLYLRRYIENVPFLSFKTAQIASLGKAQYDTVVELLVKSACAYLGNKKSHQFDAIGYTTLLMGRLCTFLKWELDKDANHSGEELRMNRTQRLVSYIDENYRQKITLSMLAEMEGISTTYLSHFFRKSFGVSFQQYLKMQRFEKALVLLRNKDVSMVDICMNCGFSDSRYLEAACMENFGCSVAEYRRRCEAQEEFNYANEWKALSRQCSLQETKECLKRYFAPEMLADLL